MVMTPHERNALIVEHIPIVGKLVRKKFGFLTRDLRDDLVGAGYLGLCKAGRDFSPRKGIRFGAYATFRIVAEMREHLRSLDPFSRKARAEVGPHHNPEVSWETLPGFDGDPFIETIQQTRYPSTLEAMIQAEQVAAPDPRLPGVRRAVKTLPAKARQATRLYLAGSSERQIAERMGISRWDSEAHLRRAARLLRCSLAR